MASSVALMPAGDLCSPVAAARRKQSQILDRWATLQTREMITTIERRSHEAELSALSNVRASSLIQMWREMEADACPRGGGGPLPAVEEVSSGSDAESEKERRGVGKLARKTSLRISYWASSSSEESELFGPGKEQLEKGSTPANFPATGSGGKVERVRGRKEMEVLVMRMKQERLREIAELAEEQKVSRFPFRERIQPLIRLRYLPQQVSTIENQQQSINIEAEVLQGGSNSMFLRETAEDASQHDGNIIEIEKHKIDSQDSDSGNSVNHSETEETQYTELVSTIELKGSPQALFTLLSREEDLQENQRSDVSWNEKNSWENSNDLKQHEDSSVLRSNLGEFIMEETKASTDCNWLSQQTFINNVEIRELLKRKTVTNFLASDFSSKLNRLIMSLAQKQALQYDSNNGRDGCEEETIWGQTYEDCSDQDPFESFNQNLSASEQDEDVMHDLRDGFSQIQSELSELRKLVESCLEWQKTIQYSIKQEFSSTADQLAERGKSSLNTKWNTSCRICCEAQVDTLLYRCGHMCACFNCSQALQWSRGKCPICCSTIIDVVQVHPNV